MADGSYVTDEERFRCAFETHAGELLRFFLARTRSVAVAEDLTEATFESAWRHVAEMPLVDETRIWLYDIGRRTLSNHWRGASRHVRLLERIGVSWRSEWELGAKDSGEVDIGAVQRAMDRLRPREKEAIRLVFWDELSHQEAAAILGCSRNALDILLHRSRRRLASIMQERESSD